MVNEEPKVAMMGRYTTTETYRLLGITYNTLMKYMKEGRIVPSMGHKRYFLGENIIKCWRRG